MATRLYLRDAAPANDPGETTQSGVLPAHAANSDFGIAVKSLSTTIGTSETSASGGSVATVDPQDNFFTSFSSEALPAGSVTAQTWTIAVDVLEQNNAANSFIVLSVYVFREPSTVVGYIYDSDTPLGAEWNSPSGQGRVATFSGSAVTAQAGDYLVLEFWQHAVQTMSVSYANTLAYDGTVDVTESSTTSAASYLETPQDLFPSIARRIFNIS